MEMDDKTLKKIFEYKKRYKWNDMDYKHCLKRKRREYKELMTSLRKPVFKKFSHEKCKIYGGKTLQTRHENTK